VSLDKLRTGAWESLEREELKMLFQSFSSSLNSLLLTDMGGIVAISSAPRRSLTDSKGDFSELGFAIVDSTSNVHAISNFDALFYPNPEISRHINLRVKIKSMGAVD
jgi:hypothetical protein